jgi:hypothetical protein
MSKIPRGGLGTPKGVGIGVASMNVVDMTVEVIVEGLEVS